MSLRPNEPPVAKTAGLRRSQRVCINVTVLVTVHRPNEKPATEQTATLVVNAHGALISLRTAVQFGDLLNLRNVKTQEEQSCRVVDINTSTPSGVPEVGVEFLVPARNFWHIAFPPADWTPRSPESKGPQPQSAQQRSSQPPSLKPQSPQPPAAARPELTKKT